jgi:hypothetical protein
MTERRHRNAYWELETLGSVALLDVIPLDKMELTTLLLYLHLLRWEKRAGVNPFPAYTGDLLLETGLSKNTLTQARNELSDLGLIQAQEQPGKKKGVWSYELRNPVTGGPLPNRGRVVYSETSNWVALEFYRRVVPGGQSSNGAFDCPWCRRTGSMRVVAETGNKNRHGTWSCDKCHRHGGFQKLYMKVNDCDYQWASHGVRNMLQALVGEEQLPATAATVEGPVEETIQP